MAQTGYSRLFYRKELQQEVLKKFEEINFECLYNEDMIAIEVCYNVHSSRCRWMYITHACKCIHFKAEILTLSTEHYVYAQPMLHNRNLSLEVSFCFFCPS